MHRQIYHAGFTVVLYVVASCSQAPQTRQSSVGQAATGTITSTPTSTAPTTGLGTNGAGTAVGNGSGTGGSANAVPNTSGGGVPGVDPNGNGAGTGAGNGAGTGAGNGTGTGAGNGSGTGATIGSTNGNIGGSPIGSKTLEQCQTANQAWRAVVNGGSQPSDCVDGLVSWCCTRDEIKNHFPTMAAELEKRFQQYIDTNGEVLYACSMNTQNAYSFSMAKIVAGTTTYDVITVSNVFPAVPAQSTPASSPSCPAVTTSSLFKMSLNLNSLSE